MRLHEWIALDRGYFQEAGIEPTVRWDIVSGIMSSWHGKSYKERPQDAPFTGASEPVDVINHCAWGSVCNAGAGLGKFVPDAYGVARWAIYVRPDSAIRRPEDLALLHRDDPAVLAVLVHRRVVQALGQSPLG